MPASRRLLFPLAAIAFPLLSACAPAQSTGTSEAIALAQKQIGQYLQQLGDLDCTETVTQEKLAENGHVLSSERDTFDYLIMMGGDENDFQLNESRLESPGTHHKLVATPMLVTNGIATVFLVFHPYYRDGFTFSTGAPEMVNGAPAIPIHFVHIPGRRSPAVLALRGRDYPLDLEGTAWLDEATKQVVKVDAGLERDMSDIGLRSLTIDVVYKVESVSGRKSQIALPEIATVDVVTPKQHWRNTHAFGGYKSFSTGAEQSTVVKVVTPQAGTSENPAPETSPQPTPKQP